MIALANADNAKEMIAANRELTKSLFGDDLVEKLADDCIKFFVEHGCWNWNRQNSITAKLYKILKNSRKGCVLNKLVQSCIVTAPHSMQTERAVKCHTLLKPDLLSSMSRDTVNERMIITLNRTAQERPTSTSFCCGLISYH